MDHIEITPDPPSPTCLVIPPDAELILPGRGLTVMELLQYAFPNPLTGPHNSASIPVWSDSLPHTINATLLLSCAVPRRETVKRLLLGVRKLVPIPRSFNRAAVLPGKTLPSHLPIWVLSFWDRLSEAYGACLSWRRCRDWVGTPRIRSLDNQRLVGELEALLRAGVCWHGYLTGKRRDRSVDNIFDLLSDEELNSGQVNDLLELIERRLVGNPDSRVATYLIAPTELAVLILSSHEEHTEPTYRKQRIQLLVEEELVQRRRLAVAMSHIGMTYH